MTEKTINGLPIEAYEDCTLHGMKRDGVPITRERYIRRAYGADNIPNPWTAEHEAELPEQLQDHIRFPELA